MGRINHIVRAMFVGAELMKEQCWATREQDAYLCGIRTRAAECSYKLELEHSSRARATSN